MEMYWDPYAYMVRCTCCYACISHSLYIKLYSFRTRSGGIGPADPASTGPNWFQKYNPQLHLMSLACSYIYLGTNYCILRTRLSYLSSQNGCLDVRIILELPVTCLLEYRPPTQIITLSCVCECAASWIFHS